MEEILPVFPIKAFDRKGELKYAPPVSEHEFHFIIKNASKRKLKGYGFRKWTGDLWLFPREWYNIIPDGYPVIHAALSLGIGKSEIFKKDKTSDDEKFGCLHYGIRINRSPSFNDLVYRFSLATIFLCLILIAGEKLVEKSFGLMTCACAAGIVGSILMALKAKRNTRRSR
jgi:hypothetical protein